MQQDDTTDPHLRCPGRGALSNGAGRFEKHAVSYQDDGWFASQAEVPLRTQVTLERPRSIISYNRSPDLGFDRSINPYRGCEHGCIYCFARPSHAWLGLSAGLDFETRLIARPDAPQVLEAELRKPGYKPAMLAIGTNTDAYQPIEKTHGIMRDCLKVLQRFNHPVGIVTKGTLVERDIDILADMAALGLSRVGISLTTLDPDLSRRMEPRAPSPKRRLQTIQRLAEAGIPVRVLTSPIIPGLTDHELEAMLEAARDAGAQAASWVMLRLPLEVSGLFRDWLAQHCPDRATRVIGLIREMHDGRDYSSDWHKRMRGDGHYAQVIAARYRRATRALGLDKHLPDLRADLFNRPPQPGDQLSLFGDVSSG
ncbi:MAG: PA0069 family radical SAM protein [Pseudomonadota bacterium]